MTNVDQIKDKARGMIIDQIDRRTTDLGNTVSEHVSNLRNMSETLRGQGQPATAVLLDTAASRLDTLSNYLRNTDGDRIVHDLESIARSQPLATAAVGFAGGLVAARLLKASASQRYRAYGNTSYGEASYGGSSYRTMAYENAGSVPLSEDDDGEFAR